MPTTTLSVLYHFQDYKGKRAQLRLWLPISAASSGGANSIAGNIASTLVSLSNAKLLRYEVIYQQGQYSGPEAAPTSNCFRRMSFLYRNGTGSGSVVIPSFVAVPPDAGDPYGPVRVTRTALLLSGLLGSVEAIVADTLKPDNTPFPGAFVVGGAAGGLEL